MRYAHVSPMGTNTTNLADAEKKIERYLPGNYKVIGHSYDSGPQILIAGEDNAGWTLDDYVLPRLASGLIFGREITEAEIRLNPEDTLKRLAAS